MSELVCPQCGKATDRVADETSIDIVRLFCDEFLFGMNVFEVTSEIASCGCSVAVVTRVAPNDPRVPDPTRRGARAAK